MAVIATPVAHPIVQCCDNTAQPVLTPVTCAGQNVLSATTSTVNGQPVVGRMRAISITQGQCATIEWQMHDQDGVPVSLSACNALPFKVVLRLKEQLSLGNVNPALQVDGTIDDASKGAVKAVLTGGMVDTPGIYYAEFALINVPAQTQNQPCVVFSNTFHLIVNRSTFNMETQPGGAPSIAEVRLHLRDSSPAESFLLDRLMFDDAEIALAITRPVQYWNEVPPPLDRLYNTQNFPFRYHWLEGICANLFLMVAEQYRRNQFNYSAGGLNVDDQNKEGSYERAGQTRWQAYREWVRGTKASINLEGCWGEVSSNYKYSAYTDAIRIRY